MKTSDEAVVILMADDDDDDQEMARRALRSAKVANEFRTVGDGEELMDYLFHRGKYAPPASSPRPGLVLLDLNMPRKDGREALREMKADPLLRSIPVIILTTSEDPFEIARAYDLGANSFIAKPVSFDGLVRVMKVATEYWFAIVHLPAADKNYEP